MKNEKTRALRFPVLLMLTSLLIAQGCDDNSSALERGMRTLPFYGTHDMALVEYDEGGLVQDTLFYTVPFFAFTNQFGDETSSDDVADLIYVADYFFTTCPTICPVMSSQMSRLQTKLAQANLLGTVKLLSHTVDPEHDTPEVLKAYGELLNADFEHWTFLTGEQEDLYYQARHGYFLTALPSDTAAGGFFHSDTFVLVDRQGHIRGYYDGTSTESVDQLFTDIQLLNSLSDAMDQE